MAGEGRLAREVRTGLEDQPEDPVDEGVVTTGVPSEVKGDALDELWHGKTIRVHVREFACVFSIIFLAIVTYLLYTGGSNFYAGLFTALTVVFLALGFLLPAALRIQDR